MHAKGTRPGAQDRGDLAYYIAGHYLGIFSIKGVLCGALICHHRYPKLYREYKRATAPLVLHSYPARCIPPERFRTTQKTVRDDLRRLDPKATMVAEAAGQLPI